MTNMPSETIVYPKLGIKEIITVDKQGNVIEVRIINKGENNYGNTNRNIQHKSHTPLER